MKLLTLSLFELKKNLFHSKNWLSNLVFLLINMSIMPFTLEPNANLLSQSFLFVVMTSILLAIVLIASHIFDEDMKDGSLDQYHLFEMPMYEVFLSKVISVACEFCLIIVIALPCAGILYAVPFEIICKILLVIIFAIPLLTSISVFGALLTANTNKNSAMSILLIFPLLISVLIILSLATGKVFATGELSPSIAYIEMNFGLTIILMPILCLLAKYLR